MIRVQVLNAVNAGLLESLLHGMLNINDVTVSTVCPVDV